MRYGRRDCNHDWHPRLDGWEEYCTAVICIHCGAFGCGCDIPFDRDRKNIFNKPSVDPGANIGGGWANPYIMCVKMPRRYRSKYRKYGASARRRRCD